LPELRNISKVSMVFKKPEKSEAGIPSFVKPKVRIAAFRKTELNRVDLPEKYRIDIKRTVFSKPEISVFSFTSGCKNWNTKYKALKERNFRFRFYRRFQKLAVT